MNNKQVTFVREYKGVSQTELSSHIQGLSQSNLSKYEKGVGQLSDEVKQRIIDFLGFPEGFYEQTIYNKVENAEYRKKAGLTKQKKDYIDLSNKLIGYIIDQMSESVEFPTFNLKTLDLEEGYTPRQVAQFTRKYMGILQGPIKDICSLLERYGIIIVEQEYDDRFDGVSFFTDKGFPVIVINKNVSNDRKRLNIAHESGHLIMHLASDIAVPAIRDKEQEAFEFAAEFLMPEDEIRNSLENLKLSYLFPLKQTWLVSMAAIIRRAKELGCLTKDRYTYFNVELSRKGYKKNEPGYVYIDTPHVFNEAYTLFKTELNYSDKELADAFYLPIEVIKEYCAPKPHLRVMRF